MIRVTDKQYWMHPTLKSNLDICTYNMPDDWDFCLVVSGTGMVRVGKSMLAQQIGYYVAHTMSTPFSLENVVFNGDELIKVAKKLPKNSVVIYDEARNELDSKKTMRQFSMILQDFFAECGIYNHFFILTLPDFFELNKYIAVNRSDALVNVFRYHEEATNKENKPVLKYKRGYFEFYNRNTKKKLYIQGKKQFHTYGIVPRNFQGEFRKYWVLNPDAYNAKKLANLQRNRAEQAVNKYKQQRDALMWILNKKYNATQQEISMALEEKSMKLGPRAVGVAIQGVSDE